MMNKRITISLAFSCSILIGFLLTSAAHAQSASQTDTVLVEVLGTSEDARYVPSNLQINAGDVIRFEVKEGLHTVTAYHPDNRRELRIPANAESFDSGPIEAGTTWFLQLNQPGVYNYFCRPHEQLGHIGRAVVVPSDKNTKLSKTKPN
jgi:plastocyanin